MHIFSRKKQSNKYRTFSFFLDVAVLLCRIKYTSHIKNCLILSCTISVTNAAEIHAYTKIDLKQMVAWM